MMGRRLPCFIPALYLGAMLALPAQSSSALAEHPPRPPSDLHVRAGIESHLGSATPLNVLFRESDGTTRSLRSVLNERATLLVPGYYRCANLCDAIRTGLARAVARSGLVLGDEFNVVLVSIDPSETPGVARAAQGEEAARLPAAKIASWHYLTGAPKARDALMRAIGFKAWFDARTGEYAHAAAVVVLSPRGVVTQYLLGVQFDPQTVRLALINASAGRIGTWVDRFILLCCDYDPSTGRYSLLIQRVLQCLGVATTLMLVALLFLLRRKQSSWDANERGP